MVSSASCVYQHIEGTTSARSWDHPLQDCDSEGFLQLGCLGPSGSVSLLYQRGLLGGDQYPLRNRGVCAGGYQRLGFNVVFQLP